MGDVGIEGMTPLHIAVGQGNIKLSTELLESGANVNVLSRAGSCPLHIAAAYGNCNLVRLLLENGADPNLEDEDGMTAIDNAIQSGCKRCQELLLACSKRKRFRPRSSANMLDATVYSSEDSHDLFQTFVIANNGYCHFDNQQKENISNTQNNGLLLRTPLQSMKNNTAGHNTQDVSAALLITSTADHDVSKANRHLDNYVHKVDNEDDESFDVALSEWLNNKLEPDQEHFDCVSFLTNDASYTVTEENNVESASLVERSGNNDINESTMTNINDDSLSQAEITFIRDPKFKGLINNTVAKREQLHTIVEVSSRFEKDLTVADNSHTTSSTIIYEPPLQTSTPDLTFVTAVSSVQSNVTCESCGSSMAVRLTKHLEEEDDGDVLALVEAHVLPEQCQCLTNVVTKANSSSLNSLFNSADHVEKTELLDKRNIEDLSNEELHRQLIMRGEQPGPITLSTRKVYELRLRRLLDSASSLCAVSLSKVKEVVSPFIKPKCEAMQIERNLIPDDLDMSSLKLLEIEMTEHFVSTRSPEYGKLCKSKTCFNYLLLDPRITNNLPARAKVLDTKEAFALFLQAVFYIGKGTRSRPFAHFKEALTYRQLNAKSQCQVSSKISHILDIWTNGYGVISLSVFHNIVATEALTREACMIAALGKNHLSNLRNGSYYGPIAQWDNNKQRQLGVFLLRKAFLIFLQEGERQIFPDEL